MNFIEAVKSLADGRCDKIKHKNFGPIEAYEDIERNKDCSYLRWCDGHAPFNNGTLILQDSWELVNEKPQTETVEVT